MAELREFVAKLTACALDTGANTVYAPVEIAALVTLFEVAHDRRLPYAVVPHFGDLILFEE